MKEFKEINTKNKGIAEIIKEADVSDFKPLPFWSINSALDESEIKRQIKEMYDFGLGGFVYHARAGLVMEYLSDKWFHFVEVALDTAKELGMNVFLYDEKGWPSGFVGGKLLEEKENRARFLRYEVLDRYDENAYAVYSYENGEVKLLKNGEKAEKYHTVYMIYSPSYKDILNPELTDKFISETYEKYYERFSDRFGKEFVGFFTDEPQYYRYETPISAVTESEFEKTYGENLKDGLLYLFLNDEKGYSFRVKYYNLMNRLYCENFYGRIYEWCNKHGCILTGHSVEETYMSTQMWGGADCATSYMYEHIPGIDNLEKSLTAEISAKSVGSTSAQIGKRRVLTETFGTSGYSTTPRQLKLIADKQYVYGVNTMVQHLYNYSFAGQGKIDCPPSFGRMMPWISGYNTFNTYIARLGYLVAHSEEITSVAVITPMESVYLDYFRLDEKETVKNVDKPFLKIIDELRRAGISYHFVNEKVLNKIGDVKSGKLIVGKKEYSSVILAQCIELKTNTVKLLNKFIGEGGTLCVKGENPRFVDGIRTQSIIDPSKTVDISHVQKPLEISYDGLLSYSYRQVADRRFLFVVNEGDTAVKIITGKAFSVVDFETLKGYNKKKVNVVPAKGSLILEEDGDYSEEYPEFINGEEIIPEVVASSPNNLTIEKVKVILDDNRTLYGYVYGVFETIAKSGYSGNVHAIYSFESDNERDIVITREKQDIKNALFNGEKLDFIQSEEDVNFELAKATAKSGTNIYEYDVDFADLSEVCKVLYDPNSTESLLNCLTYHTGLEQIYVSGQFDEVDGKLINVQPKKAGDLTVQGYGNFYGFVDYTVNLPKDAKRVKITPCGEYMQAVIYAGDKKYLCMLQEGVVIDNPKDGKILLRCYSSLKNRIGPLHYQDVDDRINPAKFTMRTHWVNEKENVMYSEKKTLTPFGLNFIKMEY